MTQTSNIASRIIQYWNLNKSIKIDLLTSTMHFLLILTNIDGNEWIQTKHGGGKEYIFPAKNASQ